MELETKRLELKEVTESDTEQIHRLHSSAEVDEYNTLGIPKNMGVTEKLVSSMIVAQKVEERKSYDWLIIRKDSGEFIGMAGMSLSADKYKLGEIYYKFFPSHWGHGFATEVAKALVKAGFNDFNLHKVEAGVATENIRSIRVLEKLGMTREGLRRKILPIRAEWKDNYHYAIVEDDPRDY